MFRRAIAALVTVVAATATLTFAHVPSARAASDPATAFLTRINDLRASHGLGLLQADAALASFATGWTRQMVSTKRLAHNPDLKSAPGSWTVAGENVGVGSSVDDLFRAFVASPSHYANLVDARYNVIGIGVRIDENGSMWTTHDFEQAVPGGSAGPAAAPAPSAAPVPPAAPAPLSAEASRSTPAPRADRGGPRSTGPAPPAAAPVPTGGAPGPSTDLGPADGSMVAAPDWSASGARPISAARLAAGSRHHGRTDLVALVVLTAVALATTRTSVRTLRTLRTS